MMRWLSVTSLVAVGCASNVTLPPLAKKSASFEARTQSFEALRPRAHMTTFGGAELHLANGVIVTEPSSLQPALEPGTAAAIALRSWNRSTAVREVAGTVAIGHFALSAVAATLGFVPLGSVRAGEGQVWLALTALIAAGVALIHGGVWGALFIASSNERDIVFDEYENSLRKRLALPDDVR